MKRAKIYLKKGKEESLLRRHPWTFSGAIERVDGELNEGDIVDIITKGGEYIATGHYQIGSIAVRVLSFEGESLDQEWWSSKVRAAYQLREALSLVDCEDTSCYRLIHGEGDSLPGLVVDVYGRSAVIQCHSVGMYHARKQIADAILSVYGDRIDSIYNKSEQTLPFKANIDAVDGYLYGHSPEGESIVVKDNGH
ncbi:MAG: class I SAM-dependent rRNA methyltransferase, partial [Rikenellaceae bacterium]